MLLISLENSTNCYCINIKVSQISKEIDTLSMQAEKCMSKCSFYTYFDFKHINLKWLHQHQDTFVYNFHNHIYYAITTNHVNYIHKYENEVAIIHIFHIFAC